MTIVLKRSPCWNHSLLLKAHRGRDTLNAGCIAAPDLPLHCLLISDSYLLSCFCILLRLFLQPRRQACQAKWASRDRSGRAAAAQLCRSSSSPTDMQQPVCRTSMASSLCRLARPGAVRNRTAMRQPTVCTLCSMVCNFVNSLCLLLLLVQWWTNVAIAHAVLQGTYSAGMHG